ncbi:PilZ domain-containing protein [Thiomicrorhabdus sp. ZW0627]|uniref:PilZ domain-containing protein n=1 Tax=Thiomicrorhabdus sp. ZW0627 TaxID=3039774 RepID=UPI00243714FB|nr:PilZ domain-containing protein [Thiomicrorhabdus sp. ZW0627]MDG6773384.1 PilZ domain-containing protein [Thiomicrorhabdus sp. ZW0627]
MKSDQRLFFRIDVMMPCSFRIVPEEELDKIPLPEAPDSKYIEEYFMQNLAQLDEQINEVVAQINLKSSLLASALSAMNSKINFMMQTIDANQLTRAIPQRLVNLSGGGVSFNINETITLNDKIDLLIKPLENEPPILVRCDVVKVTPIEDEDDAYRVALEYQNLSEEDRRKLLFFIQAKEIEFAQHERRELSKKGE